MVDRQCGASRDSLYVGVEPKYLKKLDGLPFHKWFRATAIKVSLEGGEHTLTVEVGAGDGVREIRSGASQTSVLGSRSLTV